jgi:hypothetical protein
VASTSSYESFRSWVLKFGPAIARGLRRCRPRPSDRWHLDEIVVPIAGKHMHLWRAVDHEGEVLEILVQRRRDRCGGRLRASCISHLSHITAISGAQNKQARQPKNAAVFLVLGAGPLFRFTKSTRTPLENRWLFDGALYKK